MTQQPTAEPLNQWRSHAQHWRLTMKYRDTARLVNGIILVAAALIVMLITGCGMVEGIGHDLQTGSQATRTWMKEYSER